MTVCAALTGVIYKIGPTPDKEDKITVFETDCLENYPWLDGASMKVPEKIAMYPDAGINKIVVA